MILSIVGAAKLEGCSSGIEAHVKKWNRSPGKKQREKFYWQPWAKVLFPPYAIFFMDELYMVFEHQSSHLQIEVYTHLFPLPSYSLWVCKLQRGRGYILFLIYQLYLTHSTLPGFPVGAILTY